MYSCKFTFSHAMMVSLQTGVVSAVVNGFLGGNLHVDSFSSPKSAPKACGG